MDNILGFAHLNMRYYVELFAHHSEEHHPCGVVKYAL